MGVGRRRREKKKWGGGKKRKEKKRKKYAAQTQHSKEKSIMGEFPEKNELHLSHRWHATRERETEEDRKSEGDADGYGEVYQQRCGGGKKRGGGQSGKEER